MSTTETTTSATLPAAWYRDPSGRHQRRWWDGAEWTDQVADGEVVSSDPPFRTPEAAIDHQVVEEPAVEESAAEEPAAEVQEERFDMDGLFPPVDPAALAAADAAAEPQEEPETFEEAGERKRLPIDQRPTTAPLAEKKVDLRIVPIVAVVLLVVAASLWWGFTNRSTAVQWKDRGEELQAELERSSSNADALESALARSASRGAGLEDRTETFTQIQDAAHATAQQLRECVDDVSAIIGFIQRGDIDPTDQIDRADQSCAEAGVSSDQLIAILDAISSDQ